MVTYARRLLLLLALPQVAQQGLETAATVDWERALGRKMAEEIRQGSKPVRVPEVDSYIRRIGERLGAGSSSFEVIAGTLHKEPISLPGGYVLIPAQFFLGVEDEPEFVGMLAHALSHRTGGGAPVASLGRWVGLHVETAQFGALLPLGFLEAQRRDELEADMRGLELAARAGFDAGALRRYVARVQGEDRNASALPPRALRLEKIDEALPGLPVVPASTSEGFRRIQEAVRLAAGLEGKRRNPSLLR